MMRKRGHRSQYLKRGIVFTAIYTNGICGWSDLRKKKQSWDKQDGEGKRKEEKARSGRGRRRKRMADEGIRKGDLSVSRG